MALKARPALNDDPLFTPEEASEYLGGAPSPRTMERQRSTGVGPAWVKLGHLVRYRKSALDLYIEHCGRLTSESGERARAKRKASTTSDEGSAGRAA